MKTGRDCSILTLRNFLLLIPSLPFSINTQPLNRRDFGREQSKDEPAKNKGGVPNQIPQSKMVALSDRQHWLSVFPAVSQSPPPAPPPPPDLLSLIFFLDGSKRGSPIILFTSSLGAMPRFSYGNQKVKFLLSLLMCGKLRQR